MSGVEINEVVGVVRGDDGVLRYKIFIGNHHNKPVYFYTPVTATKGKSS